MSNTDALTAKEFEVLQKWYDEWTRINRYVLTLASVAIGFTITLFKLARPEGGALPSEIENIRMAWVFLGICGLAAALSITVAYLWIDIVYRLYAPELKTRFLRLSGTYTALSFVTRIAWVFTIVSGLCLIAGFVFVIRYAWTV